MRRKNRVETLFSSNDTFDAFITKLPSNITYLVGITFPFPEQSPFSAALIVVRGSDEMTMIVPAEWVCVLKKLSWKGKSIIYSINDGSPEMAFRNSLTSALEKLNVSGKKVGIDYSAWTVGEIVHLKETCPNMGIVDIDATLNSLREIKSPDEIERIQAAAHIADRGIIGALNHIEGVLGSGVRFTLSEFLEHIRAHAIEFGASAIGYLNIAQGRKGRSWYTPIYDHSFVKEGNVIRVDYTLSYHGCWTKCSRMFFTGKPGQSDAEAFRSNKLLKDFAVSILRPGIRVTEFCEAVRLKAEDEDIELLYDEGLGHGIGASEYEMPFLTEDNEEVLKPGMVIALDVRTIGSKDEVIHSIDIYELTHEGTRCLSDFRNWDSMYVINGVQTIH